MVQVYRPKSKNLINKANVCRVSNCLPGILTSTKKQLTTTNLLNLLGSLFHTELTDLSGSGCLLLGLQVNFQASLETKAVQGHDNVRY